MLFLPLQAPLSILLCSHLVWNTIAFRPNGAPSRLARIAFDTQRIPVPVPVVVVVSASSTGSDDGPATATATPAPVLNGKRVLPYKIMMNGLKGQKFAAVYAVLKSNFQRGSEGWDAVSFVGVSHDLETTLRSLSENDATDLNVAHVRALSFSFPQPNAMQDVAMQWRELATKAGAVLEENWANDVLTYLFDQEDEDDDENDEMDMMADAMAFASNGQSIVSPFDASQAANSAPLRSDETDDSPLVFNAANVDMVLNEVRPYLIADGGNVAVERVDELQKNVYLKLEGACGSCASSTVTMQMGIERVLKEKFPDINEVLQVEDDDESKPKELTWTAVEDEINRLKPAITAMGGVVRLINVDAATGVVDMEFRGASRVRQGLELAILDVSFVELINFLEVNDGS